MHTGYPTPDTPVCDDCIVQRPLLSAPGRRPIVYGGGGRAAPTAKSNKQTNKQGTTERAARKADAGPLVELAERATHISPRGGHSEGAGRKKRIMKLFSARPGEQVPRTSEMLLRSGGSGHGPAEAGFAAPAFRIVRVAEKLFLGTDPPHLFCKLSLEPALRAVGLELLSQSPKMHRRRRGSEYWRRRRQKKKRMKGNRFCQWEGRQKPHFPLPRITGVMFWESENPLRTHCVAVVRCGVVVLVRVGLVGVDAVVLWVVVDLTYLRNPLIPFAPFLQITNWYMSPAGPAGPAGPGQPAAHTVPAPGLPWSDMHPTGMDQPDWPANPAGPSWPSNPSGRSAGQSGRSSPPIQLDRPDGGSDRPDGPTGPAGW
eukprot:gene18130-biopygen6886